jgi:preprotein translocase subunit SecF
MIINPKKWQLISIATVALSIAIIVFFPPKLGIDFTGGSLLEFTADQPDPIAVQNLLRTTLNLPATVQTSASNRILIRTSPLDETVHPELVSALKEASLVNEELRFESIGPTIGDELRRKSLIAVSVAIAVMIIYLAYTFRQTGGLVSSWKFGVAAAVALLHDLLVVTALFAILGQTNNVVIDTLFVTAILAILGYSVNDTIVLFDRLKEEWLATRTGSLSSLMNRAAQTTLMRSLNTSLTTLLVLITLLIFGGSTIRWFIVALAAGTIVGTYSSLFVSLPVLHFLSKSK